MAAEKTSSVRDYIVLEQVDEHPPLGDNPVGTRFTIRRVVRARNDTQARKQVVESPGNPEDTESHAAYHGGKLVAITAGSFQPKKPTVTTRTIIGWEDA